MADFIKKSIVDLKVPEFDVLTGSCPGVKHWYSAVIFIGPGMPQRAPQPYINVLSCHATAEGAQIRIDKITAAGYTNFNIHIVPNDQWLLVPPASDNDTANAAIHRILKGYHDELAASAKRVGDRARRPEEKRPPPPAPTPEGEGTTGGGTPMEEGESGAPEPRSQILPVRCPIMSHKQSRVVLAAITDPEDPGRCIVRIFGAFPSNTAAQAFSTLAIQRGFDAVDLRRCPMNEFLPLPPPPVEISKADYTQPFLSRTVTGAIRRQQDTTIKEAVLEQRYASRRRKGKRKPETGVGPAAEKSVKLPDLEKKLS